MTKCQKCEDKAGNGRHEIGGNTRLRVRTLAKDLHDDESRAGHRNRGQGKEISVH
jgi:hypothetical protein